ncbi:MAG: hypothetical protein V3V01_00265 [Acidimicrobiales bacterium]
MSYLLSIVVLILLGFVIGASPTSVLGSTQGISPATASLLVAALGIALVGLVLQGSQNQRTRWILAAGLVFRLGLTGVRYAFDGTSFDSDSFFYRSQASELLDAMGAGWWPPGGPSAYVSGPAGGNDWISLLIAWIYKFVGTDMYTSFVFMSGIAFLGTIAFVRAIRASYASDRATEIFAAMLSFAPSIAVWTATGKDAVLFASLGFIVMAWFEYLDNRLSVFGVAGAAIFGLAGVLIRPHIILLVAGALLISLFVSRGVSEGRRLLGMVMGTVGVAFLIAASRGLVGGVSVAEAITAASERSAFDDAVITPSNPLTPIGYLQSALTVYVRPYPWEVVHVFSFLAALEGIIVATMIGAVAYWRRRIVNAVGVARSLFLVSYLAVAIFAFGTVGNLGVIARQRVQITPMLFLLVSVGIASRGQALTGMATTDETGQVAHSDPTAREVKVG